MLVVGPGVVSSTGAIGESVIADWTPFVNFEGVELTIGANTSQVGMVVGVGVATFGANDGENVV